MMVSTKGRYALRVLIDIAMHPQDEYVSLKGIAERQDVSMKYIETIVAVLSKADILESLRGKNGGYRFKESPDKCTVASRSLFKPVRQQRVQSCRPVPDTANVAKAGRYYKQLFRKRYHCRPYKQKCLILRFSANRKYLYRLENRIEI